MKDDQLFEVESPVDGDPLPAQIFFDELSGQARSVLMAVHGRPRSVLRPTLVWITSITGLSRSGWLKASRELVHRGWLIRKNHGGGGRGKGFRHERIFLRTPRKNPLLG